MIRLKNNPRFLLASLLLAPTLVHAVVYEWVDPKSNAKYMAGDMPECYANPVPGCPRIKVYQNGQVIDDTGRKARDAAAVHRAILHEGETSLAQQRIRQIQSITAARQASADAKQAEDESSKETKTDKGRCKDHRRTLQCLHGSTYPWILVRLESSHLLCANDWRLS